MKKIFKFYAPILFSFVLIFTIFGNTFSVNAAEDISSNLKNKIVPLKTVNPKDDLKDLMPLKETLKDKQIVGMGEATHGTSEFFQMKHRMFKFLVEEMGFRAFAIEASFGECQMINDYVLNGIGTEDEVMNSMIFWVWNTDEVKEMIHWMREYNLKADNNNKIRFYGFDMQSITFEQPKVKAYLEKVKPSLVNTFCNNIPTNFDKYDLSKLDASSKVLKDIIKEFQTSKDTMIKMSSASEYEMMVKYLDIISQNIESKVDPLTNPKVHLSSLTLRDKCMAQNIKWIIDRETSLGKGKIMLWAHNGHINDFVYATSQEEHDKVLAGLPIDSNILCMGTHLKNMYGDKYYGIGFEFCKGNFRAKDSTSSINTVFTLKESQEDTLGFLFNKLSDPIFFLDFKNALKDSNINKYFSENLYFINNIGSGYNVNLKNRYISPINVRKTFDGIIFVRETTESKLIPKVTPKSN